MYINPLASLNLLKTYIKAAKKCPDMIGDTKVIGVDMTALLATTDTTGNSLTVPGTEFRRTPRIDQGFVF